MHWLKLTPLCCTLLTGCTAKLTVFDENGAEAKGIPIHAPEAFVMEGNLTALAKGGQCKPAAFTEFTSLPVGQRFYLNPVPGPLADSQFNIEFDASGAVTKISLNSNPEFNETLDSITNLAGTLLPILSGAPPVADPGPGSADPTVAPRASALPACDAGKKIAAITPFREWRKLNTGAGN